MGQKEIQGTREGRFIDLASTLKMFRFHWTPYADSRTACRMGTRAETRPFQTINRPPFTVIVWPVR